MEPAERTLRADWQQEFAEVRAQGPCPWARLFAGRLVFLPRRLRWLAAMFGPAFVVGPLLVVGPRLLVEAPPDVRRFVLAHEWAHVRRGHPFFTVAGVAGVVAMAAPWPRGPWSLAGLLGAALVLLLVVAAAVPAARTALERSADGLAAEVVGADVALAALDWLATRFAAGPPTRAVRARRSALLERARQTGASG